MPYITQEKRYELENCGFAPQMLAEVMENGGELNYVISSIVSEYLNAQGLRYQNISDIVGALEGAKQEFFRMVVNPYEELKALENGGLRRYQNTRELI